ncbi:MAG: hypothetical protein ACRYGG_21015 [Janthinobacterium lividum]
MGIDPGPFTLRQLSWMSRGHQSHSWTMLTHVLTTMVNVMRSQDTKPITFADVFPAHLRDEPQVPDLVEVYDPETARLAFKSMMGTVHT